MPQANPLADDIADEFHAFLLEKGNLKSARKAIRETHEAKSPVKSSSTWTGEHNWTFAGYQANLASFSCKCGNRYSHLEGIFIKETRLDGASRLTRVNPRGFQPSPEAPFKTQNLETSLDLCPACIPFPQHSETLK